MLKLSQKKRKALLALAVAATVLGANNAFAASVHDKAISESNNYGASMRTYWKNQGVYDAANHTYTFNEDIMDDKKAETPGVNTVAGSNAEIRTALTGSDSAIGYLGFSYAEDGAVGVITLDGVTPTSETIKDGSYELARKLYFYTFGDATKGAQAFIEFMTGADGQKVAEEYGFVPL